MIGNAVLWSLLLDNTDKAFFRLSLDVPERRRGIGRALVQRVEQTVRHLVSVKLADVEPLVTSSTGQQGPNALYRIADQALGAVERCERQLGIGARNRAGLGSALLSETKTLAQLNQRETPLSIVDDGSHDPRTHPPA